MKIDDSNTDRFFKKIKFDGECWIWLGGTSSNGYDRFRIGNKLYSPHRLIYEYFYESIPKGYIICHHCDNPRCVNPGHLFCGTYRDNLLDAFDKGLKHSFSFEACSKGGIASRITSPEGYSWCTRCQKHLLVENFTKRKSRWNGFARYCKSCVKDKRKLGSFKKTTPGRMAESG